MARLGGGTDEVPRAGGQPLGASRAPTWSGPGLPDRGPVVEPGAADDVHQARGADRAASAGHGGALAVPTWTNNGVVSLADPDWRPESDDPETVRGARELMQLYAKLGCKPTWTCAASG